MKKFFTLLFVAFAMSFSAQAEDVIFEDDFNWVPFTGATDQCAYNNTGETRADKAAFKDHADNQGWTSKTTWAYTRPGYMKLGKSNYGGDFCSPALAKIEGNQKVTLTFQAVVYCSKTGVMDPGVLHVAVLNAGTITKISGGMKTNNTDAIDADYAVAAYPEIKSAATIQLDPENPSGTEPGNAANIGDVNSNPADCWNNEVSKYTIEIEGATSATQILFVGGTYNAGPTDRPCIDNVKVIKTPAPTAVQSVINESAKKEIYTLDGVRVNSNKLERGIYIVNGKKVWMK